MEESFHSSDVLSVVLCIVFVVFLIKMGLEHLQMIMAPKVYLTYSTKLFTSFGPFIFKPV